MCTPLGIGALLEASDILNIDKEKQKYWQETLQNVAAYPTDNNGFMVGADLPFTESHRHYSHLLMIYPLYLVNIENETVLIKNVAYQGDFNINEVKSQSYEN